MTPCLGGEVPATQSLGPNDVAPLVAYLGSDAARDITGKIVDASGGDALIYGNPLDVAGSRMVRANGRWTIEELAETLPTMVGI